MKIAIIGAGAAGLAAARHTIEHGHTCDIFEQSGNVGGTWKYTDKTDKDEYGLPIHSSMYQNLRTNLPKELMEYKGFHYPNQKTSYISQKEVLEYMENYAKELNLEPHIKYFTHVIKVDLLELGWQIKVNNLIEKTTSDLVYDAVMVCSGHYSKPLVPNIQGIDQFKGTIKHSHIYRSSEPYRGRRVLIVGAGPSGQDISRIIAEVATQVLICHSLPKIKNSPPIVLQKPWIKTINSHSVLFQDNSEEEIDDILLCTGYKYDFPFLTENCGIISEDNFVRYLYKHIINIKHPTMALIGIPFAVCPFPLFDIQVIFFLSILNGHFKPPSENEMMEDLNRYIAEKKKLGIPMRHFHKLGEEQGSYFDDLATTANIDKIPPVIQKLYVRVRMGKNFSDCFKIVDDEEFLQIA